MSEPLALTAEQSSELAAYLKLHAETRRLKNVFGGYYNFRLAVGTSDPPQDWRDLVPQTAPVLAYFEHLAGKGVAPERAAYQTLRAVIVIVAGSNEVKQRGKATR